jgi:hypothetical protein
MAVTNTSAVNTTTFSWSISGMSSAWNTANYQSAGIFSSPATSGQPSQPSGIISSTSPPASGSNTFTPTLQVSGQTPGNTYTVYGNMRAANGLWYPAGSSTVTLPMPPQVPQGTPVVSLTPQTGHTVLVNASGVTGATGYAVLVNLNQGGGDVVKASNTTLPYSMSLTNEFTYITVSVFGQNATGSGTTGRASTTTKDETAPTITNFYATSASTNSITVLGSFTDPLPTLGAASGVDRMEFWRGGAKLYTYYGNTYNYTYTGLAPNTAYTLELRVYDLQGLMTTQQRTSSTTNRPANYSWTTAKNQGAIFKLTAAEWNGLISSVNAFRSYKGLGAGTYNSAVTGNNFTAAQFNQVRTAISAMTPPVALPATVVSGGRITAAGLNGLVNSLNSIT